MTKKTPPTPKPKYTCGRKGIFQDDVSRVLSIQVPSKQYDNFHSTLMEMRKPFEKPEPK